MTANLEAPEIFRVAVEHRAQALQAAAKLPDLYINARTALAECARVDECKTWADKAAALASYAKQARDEALFKTASRIRARAIDRAGELLKQFDARGDHRKKDSRGLSSKTRNQAVTEAGMSERQGKQAVRVNNVPRDQFNALVEGDDPPSPAALAEIGKSKRRPILDLGERSASDFKAATTLIGATRAFRLALQHIDLAAAWRGADDEERSLLREQIGELRRWCGDFLRERA